MDETRRRWRWPLSWSAGAWSAFVGGLVLFGWTFDIAAFKSLHPSWVAMKPNTALGFGLVGLSLMMTSGSSPTRAARVAARLCALLAGLIGVLTLGEYVLGVSIGIDQLLFSEPAGAVGTSVPGRMAPETALCFALLATAIWITRSLRQTPWVGRAAAVLGLLVTTLALAALFCYLTPALGAFGWWGLTIMAVHAALTFAVLGLTVIFITWQQGVLSWSLNRKTTVAFAGGLVLLVIIGLNTSRSQVRLRQTAQEVAHSREVLGGIEHMLAAVADAQIHARDYLLTGDERFLRSHLSALARCKGEMDELRVLIADRPRQQIQFAQLAAQIEGAFQWSDQAIDASRIGKTAVSRLQLVGHGEDLVDNLSATFEQVASEERQFLEQAVQKEDKADRSTYQVIFTGTLASLAIFLTLLFGLNRAAGERQRAEEVLREKNEQLGAMTQQLWQVAKLATMGELVAGIAHELNSPLTTISLHLEDLLARASASGDRQILGVIDQEVDRMARLVAELLQSSGRRQPQISSVDLRQELDSTLELVHFHLRNHGVSAAREYAPELPLVQVDRQQVRQVLLNLFTNAGDAMPQGGVLTIRAYAQAGGNVLEIIDNGVGIAPEDLPRVIEPFFTTKEEGKGTGLGLAICRRIMQEHGGTIQLDSQPGKGTTVRLFFPENNGFHVSSL